MTESDAYRALRALPFGERVKAWRAAVDRARFAQPEYRRSSHVVLRRFCVLREMRDRSRA